MMIILDENELNAKLERAYKDGLNDGLSKQNEVNGDNIVKMTKDEYNEDIEKAHQEGFEKGKLEGAVGEYSRGFSEGYKQGMETNNFRAPMPIPVPGGWTEPGTAPNPYPYPYPNPITCPQVWYSSTMTSTDTAKGFERK